METMIQREYTPDVECVFGVLLNILSERYDVKNIDKTIRCVEVSFGMSLFSFGETFEVIVAAQNSGSVVRVRAKSRVRWNVTSNVEEKVKKLFDLLEENLD